MSPTQPLRVLLCDDVEPLLDAMERALAKRLPSLECARVRKADDALELARRERFAAVITDYHLGGRNGIELCLRLRHEHPDVGLMLMSAYGDLPLSVGGFGAIGIDCVLQKPFNILRLSQVVRYVTHTDPAARRRIREKYAFFVPSDAAADAGGADASAPPNACATGHVNPAEARFCSRCGLRLEPRLLTLQYEPYLGDIEEARRLARTLSDPAVQRMYARGIERMEVEARERLHPTR